MKTTVFDLGILVLVSIVSIVAFLLLNEAFIEMITSWGWRERAVEINTDGFWRYLLALFLFGVLPAVIEELVFRGLLLKLFLRFGAIFAIVGSSVLFSVYHLNFAQTLYQFILGVVLACVVIRTGRLWYAIVLHFLNNFIVITYIYVTDGAVHSTNWGGLQIFIALFLASVGTLVIVELIKMLNVKEKT